jgi:hypothetical protein
MGEISFTTIVLRLTRYPSGFVTRGVYMNNQRSHDHADQHPVQ